MRAAGVALVMSCLSSIAAPSRAQDAKELTGVVLALDGGEVVIDLGKKQGVSDGDTLELWRPLKLKHPVTGKLVADRFKIGALKVVQARDVLSLARPTGAVSRPIETGDVVILPGAFKPATPAVAAKPPTPTPDKPGKPGAVPPPFPATPTVVEADPEVRALGALFESLSGADPEVRAKAYEKWVRDNPKSRFAGVLQEEAIALRKAGTVASTAPATGASGTTGTPDAPVLGAPGFKKVDETREATALTFAVQLTGPVSGAVLQVRSLEDPAYTPIPFTAMDNGFWTVTVPAERVRAPSLSWFVEAVTPDGKSTPVIGSAGDPLHTKVVKNPTSATPLKHESIASLWTDYADYNKLNGKDYAWQTEGYFGMRFGDVGVRALRSGFGVYRGRGGSLEDLDVRGLTGRKVGLSYGYIEGEFGFDPFWALVTRLVIGLGNDEVKGGGQAFVRIGNDKKTNLMIGGEILGGVGLRGITQLELGIFKRIPILVRSEVTNQPAGESLPPGSLDNPKLSESAGDLGVRAIVQAGYRITPSFTLFGRFSYQGRTINHAGPGFGGGASFTW